MVPAVEFLHGVGNGDNKLSKPSDISGFIHDKLSSYNTNSIGLGFSNSGFMGYCSATTASHTAEGTRALIKL